MELVVVVIIVGVLASLVIPKFTFVFEKIKSAEGLQILESLRKAQWVYYYEHGNEFTSVYDDLDVTLSPLKYFQYDENTMFNLWGLEWEPHFSITITRTNNLYSLIINDTGDISCTAIDNSCSKLGY